jgi:hypothetical protein
LSMKLHAPTHLFVNCGVQSNRSVMSVVFSEKRQLAHLQTNNFMNRFRNHCEQSTMTRIVQLEHYQRCKLIRLGVYDGIQIMFNTFVIKKPYGNYS